MDMTSEQLTQDILQALGTVPSSVPGQDVVSRGQVQNLEVGEDGTVRLSFFLDPDDPGTPCQPFGRAGCNGSRASVDGDFSANPS